MPTPTKPASVLKEEKKSHRTKAEMKQREQGEAALATGTELKERPEVKKNPVAHKEFRRLSKLLETIEKNDAIYETVINRYCLMHAECFDLEEKREKIFKTAAKMEEKLDAMEEDVEFTDLRDAIKSISSCYSSMIACDKQIQAKRKMLFDIERENIMTIAAALRSIPKTPEQAENPLLTALRGEE